MAKKGRPAKFKPLDTEMLVSEYYGDRYIQLFHEMGDWEDDDYVKKHIRLVGYIYKKWWPNLSDEELVKKVSQQHVFWYQNEILQYYKVAKANTQYSELLKICIKVVKDNFKQYLMTGLKHYEIDPEDLASEILLNVWRKGNYNYWHYKAEKYSFLKQEIKGYLSDMNKTKDDGEGLGRIDKNIDYSRNYFSESYKQSKQNKKKVG